MLLVGTGGEAVRLLDAATGELRWELQGEQGGVGGDGGRMVVVSVSRDGRFFAAVGDHGEHWKLWNAWSGGEGMTGGRHDGTGACSCVMTWEEGEEEEGSSEEEEEEKRGAWKRVLDPGCPVVAHTEGLLALAFSPSGETLATGGEDRAVILWDTQTGEAGHRMQREGAVVSLSFSMDGARLAGGSSDGAISVWATATGALLRTIPHAHERLSWVQFSPIDGARLATAGGDSFVRQWDVDSGQKLESVGGNIFAVYSPDGRNIATANPIGESDVHLVDAQTGALRLVMAGLPSTEPAAEPPGVLSCATFSVDGSKLATGSYDDTCRVWDLSSGALLRTITLKPCPVFERAWGSNFVIQRLGECPVLSVAWGRDWVRDTQVAFAMGYHPRLGANSQVLALEAGVLRMILDRV